MELGVLSKTASVGLIHTPRRWWALPHAVFNLSLTNLSIVNFHLSSKTTNA
jgi:hypothetical protein